MTVALLLAAALAVACVIVVGFPFLKEPDPETDVLDELDDDERRRLALLEARDRALSALKELEFDHRTGAITDYDYREQVGGLRREAAAALQALNREVGESGAEAPDGEGRPVGGRT